MSYSFTAGSYGRRNSIKNALGSFIFGGYGASLKGSADMSFDFAPDEERELVVAVQSISKTGYGETASLLPNPIFVALDSSQPNIWLPQEACREFEDTFGLTWNETAERYLLNSTLHDHLVEDKATLTLRLGNGNPDGPTIDIVLPYSALDLTMTNSTVIFSVEKSRERYASKSIILIHQ